MMKIDEVLKITEEMGIQLIEDESGKQYIVDRHGNKIEFSIGASPDVEKK